MAVNRLVDAGIDAQNPRTAGRHLTQPEKLKRNHVALFAVTCAIVFVGGTSLFLPNPLPLWLSVPVLLFLAGYSLAKLFNDSVHFWLGIALAPRACLRLDRAARQTLLSHPWGMHCPLQLLGQGLPYG